MIIPSHITMVGSGLFLDGGSIRLEAIDNNDRNYDFFLDWSFKAQDTHSTQFFQNKFPVLKQSDEQMIWLELLEHATFRSKSGEEISSLADEPWCMTDAEITDLFKNATPQTGLMMKYLAAQVIEHIQSPSYTVVPTPLVVKV